MAKKKHLKALVMGAVAMTLSCSMLVGTTFAWFTDSVTSSNNVIKSGNLDVELEYRNSKTTSWTTVGESTNVFQNDFWEPGHTEVVYLKVSNAGSLDFKYKLGVNVASETPSTNVYGDPFELSDYIYFDVVNSATEFTYANRAEAMADTTETTTVAMGYSNASSLEAQTSEYATLIVYMPETTGNVVNHAKNAPVPTINLGINVVATQIEAEEDSFGDDYDGGAPWLGGAAIDWYAEDPTATEYTLTSAEDLAGLAELVNGTAEAPATTFSLRSATLQDDFKGKTLKLSNDIDLKDIPWTAIGTNPNPFLGNFDGQGHTIYNLNVNNEGWAGLFGHVGLGVGSTIENVTVNGAKIDSNRMAGVIVGQIYGDVENCHVSNATIKVVPNLLANGSYDNGDKVGGIVGWLGDIDNNRVLDGCSVENVNITAYRDVGGIAGYVASSTTVSNNIVKGENTIAVDQITNYYGDKAFNAGAVYGRTDGTVTEINNQVIEEGTKVTEVYSAYQVNGLHYIKQGEEVIFDNVPADYTGNTVTVAEGTTRIDGYAFDGNPNIQTIELASTVKKLNDKAFRDTSASTVILNEGLTNISYQAFRNAENVKSVTIPSTVTTISLEAFQLSGIETLTVPETVTTIEYGAMRDMKMLESVTIKGNVNIPVYAFRACTNLKTVVLEGDDVTFGAGSKGMIFTNKENGDGSAITVYVQNETVKARLLAADTAATDYGGYTIVVASNAVSNSEELVDAINNASDGDTIIIDSGDYALRFTNQTSFNVDNLNFVGGGNVNLSISSSEVWYGRIQGSKVSFTNIHFTSSVGATGEATYNNCEFDDWTILASSNNEKTYFNDCTVKGTLNTSIDFSAGDAYMNGCTIENVEASGNATMYFENCNIGKLISWNMNMVLTNCEVETLDLSHMTTNSVIVDGVRMVAVLEALQSELNKAVDGTVIALAEDIQGDVTAPQAPNVKVTVDGREHTFAGVLTVDGKSGTYTTAGLTVKNVTFRADSISADACIRLGGTNNTRYTCNVTVENCTFDVNGAVGVKSYTGGDKNLTIKGCTATANAHSLAQLKGIDGVLVEGCTVKSVRGINFNNSLNVTVKDSTIDVQKYALRFGEGDNTTVENFSVIDCTLKSANVDGDAAIVLRAGATNANLTITNTTIVASIQMSGHENANVVIQ